jgi:hypothetical protein
LTVQQITTDPLLSAIKSLENVMSAKPSSASPRLRTASATMVAMVLALAGGWALSAQDK